MEWRIIVISNHSKSVATISVIEDDKRAQEANFLSLEQASKDTMNKDLIPDKVAMHIREGGTSDDPDNFRDCSIGHQWRSRYSVCGCTPKSEQTKLGPGRENNCRRHATRALSCPRVKHLRDGDASVEGHDCGTVKSYCEIADNC